MCVWLRSGRFVGKSRLIIISQAIWVCYLCRKPKGKELFRIDCDKLHAPSASRHHLHINFEVLRLWFLRRRLERWGLPSRLRPKNFNLHQILDISFYGNFAFIRFITCSRSWRRVEAFKGLSRDDERRQTDPRTKDVTSIPIKTINSSRCSHILHVRAVVFVLE